MVTLGAHGQAVEFSAVKAAEQPAQGQQLAGAAPEPIGLALSGGGIRSATFSLGVLQALAARRRLASFDYLSTVSGGGYIGAWMSAWIYRFGLKTVQEELGRASASAGAEPVSAEAAPLQWLRRYSNYLTPRVGLFSSDALTVMSIWMRNVVLTLIVVFLVFAVVVMLPRLVLLHLLDSINARAEWLGYTAVVLGCGLLPGVMMANLMRLRRPGEGSRWLASSSGVAWTVVLPGVLAATAASAWLFARGEGQPPFEPPMLIMGGILIAVVTALWLTAELRRQPGQAGRERPSRWQLARELWVYVQALAVALACGGGALWAMHRAFPYDGSVGGAVASFTLGPAAILVVAGLAGWIFVGLVGRVFYERSREWWSRMNALFISAGALLFLVNLCAFYVPALAATAWNSTWLRGLFSTGWLGSLLLVWLGPRKSSAPPPARWSMMSVANAAAIVGMIGFIVAAAFLLDLALAKAAQAFGGPLPGALYPASLPGYVDQHVAALCAELKLALLCLPFLWWAFLATALAMVVFGQRVDVNKFSLHNMYKDRLIRCYLGASNAARNPHPFTGFDESDDLALRDLASRSRPQRPYHIFNTALNLSQGKNLAWQERKAAAFALTPLYCGFGLSGTQGELSGKLGQPNGVSRFRPTAQYAGRDGEEPGISLGTAMATSGAAANPNGGIHTRPALAFMMTLLNLRLGRWCPNPACTSWRSPSPLFGVLYLLQELFGFSNDTSRYINLSDGGHFENTGIYELVRRRCHVIVMVDAGADGERGFNDLGRAIRQCRIDFGVEISIDLAALRRPGKDALPGSGVASGTIDYGAGFARGTLIVIKPTLCAGRREPVDVLNYATRNPAFPQQSTADQFFDESQFESYRQLGLYLGNQCLDIHENVLPERPIADLGAASVRLSSDRETRTHWLRRMWPVLPWASAGLLLLLSVFNGTCLSSSWNALRQAQQCGVPEAAVALAAPDWCPRAVFLYLDTFAVLLYSATFMAGQRLFLGAALKGTPLMARYPVLIALALGLALAGGFADIVENTLVMSAMSAAGSCLPDAPPTPFWTTAKFVLFGINLGLLLAVRWYGRRRDSGDAAGGGAMSTAG